MVVTQYIPPKDGKPGLYEIKNSDGEDGGSSDFLIEDKLLRDMHVGFVSVAIPIERSVEARWILKYKQQLDAAEIETWKEEAFKLKEIVKSREVEIETILAREKSLGWRLLEYQHRAAIPKVEMETRIQMLNEELLKQRKLGQQREIAAKWWKEEMRKDNQNLEKQLVEARRHQEICVPDSPIHKQDGPWCLNFSTATWMRKTLTNQFFLTLPAHNKIVRNIGKQSSNEVGVGPGGFYAQMECIKKEAARWNLEVVELNVWKEGGFDRAHEHLKKGYALWWALQPREWGPIKEHISKSSYGYLGQYEWAAIKHLVAERGHSMVITQYIEPGAGKPGFYRIKNSHGENGGSHGQKGYVLIVDNVLREIKPQYVFVATPKNIAAEAFGGG